MFSAIVGKSKCSQALFEMSCFYDLGKPGTELFKTHKTGTVWENHHEWDTYPQQTMAGPWPEN
jgi:hypothetical protein